MIVGSDFFGYRLNGNVWDTAIPTSNIDELYLYQGIYDEMFVTLDMSTTDANEKPTRWNIRNIMNAKFQNDLEAGSIDVDGQKVTGVHIYRRKYGIKDDWLMVGRFDYDENYNVYSFIDRGVENGATYEYAVVPTAEKVLGNITKSLPVKVDFEGIYISDNENNYKLEMNYAQDKVSYNRNASILEPLNSKFPIAVFGNPNYRSGDVTFLPISNEQKESRGHEVDGKLERLNRKAVTDFLTNGRAKILRNDNGDVMIITTDNVSASSISPFLPDVQNVTFEFTEVGEVNSHTLEATGLIRGATKSFYTFDEAGDVVWDI